MNLRLRPCPRPWRAMLAICSDLDETPDANTYFETSRFLNTTDDTSLGPGAGLETGNTIYFDMPPGQFSYRSGSDADRDRIHTLIRSGHIDCLHSFGDLAATRADVERAWAELSAAGAIPEVWVDHARAPTNFDPTLMEGGGALPAHAAFHADLSIAAGLRYVWKGRVTSVVAKEAPLSLRGILNATQPVASAITLAKEAAKIGLAVSRGGTYAMHARRELISPQTLADGTVVSEFIRSNPCWGGVSHSETADGICEVLAPRVLSQLVRAGGRSVFYTHLGKSRTGAILPETAIAAFRQLAEYQTRGQILVTTTRRLLGYCDAWHSSRWSCNRDGSELNIVINSELPSHDLAGLTWWTDEAVPYASATLPDGSKVELECRPGGDEPATVAVPWAPLTYPRRGRLHIPGWLRHRGIAERRRTVGPRRDPQSCRGHVCVCPLGS